MAMPRSRSAKSGARSKKPQRTGLGGGKVDEHLNKPRAKRQSRFASVGDGNTIVARAVDTEKLFDSGPVHPVKFERKDGSEYTMDIRCLDPDDKGLPCPGCRDDLERRFKFWLVVIVRDAPKLNKAGKEIGEEDRVAILSGANRLVKALNAKHKRRALDKRDVEISQDGEGFDVQYEVEWADDEDTPLSSADKKLIKGEDAQGVIEAFERYTAIPDEEDFYDPPTFDDNEDDDDDPAERSRSRGSVFAKERKGRGKSSGRRRAQVDEDEEEDDEDDEDERPARRRIGAAKKRTADKPKPALKRIGAAKKSGSSGGKTIKRRTSR